MPGQVPDPRSIRVATYNLYLGADLSLILESGDTDDPAQLSENLAEVQRQLMATPFPARAGKIADVLVDSGVDLVGVQEMCCWQVGGEELWDFAEILREALESRGATYDVVAEVATFEGGGQASFEGLEAELHLRGSNAVLLRRGSGIRVLESETGVFGDALGVRSLGAPVAITRGWCGVACELDGQRFGFVNTHTEAYDARFRNDQRDELVQTLGQWEGPLVIVGDLNATPDRVGMPEDFIDAWAVAGEGDGYTCCQTSDLTNAASQLEGRVDYVWVRGLDVREAWLIGDQPKELGGGLRWASDHAGVVARLGLGG